MQHHSFDSHVLIHVHATKNISSTSRKRISHLEPQYFTFRESSAIYNVIVSTLSSGGDQTALDPVRTGLKKINI